MVQSSERVLQRTRRRDEQKDYGSGVLMIGYVSYPGRLTDRYFLSRSNSSGAQTAFMRSGDLSISGGKVRKVPVSAMAATQSLSGAR
jgi:hypothetical protein